MVDNSGANQHLRTSGETLDNTREGLAIETLVNKTALNLSSTLSNGKDLFIDNDILNKLATIEARLNGSLLTDINNELRAIPAAPTGRGRDPYEDERRLYNRLSRNTNIGRRHTEYLDFLTIARQFDLTSNLTNITCGINGYTVPGGTVQTVNVSLFGTPVPDEFELCDGDGNPLKKSGNNYEIQVNGVTVTLSNVTFNSATHSYDFSGMSVSPSNIDISKALKLSITGKYHSHQHTGVNIALNKAFSLSLTEGGPSNATERRREMDEYNTLGGNVIGAQLLNTFENEEAKILRDGIERSVSRINSPIFNGLSDEQKEGFYRRVLDVTYTTLPYIPYPTGTHDRRGLAACLEHYCNYTDFSNWFTADGRGRNKNANTTRTPQTYRQYVHDHFQEESKNYFNTQIDRILSNLTNETAIKAALSNYLVDIENNKRDNQTVRNAVDSGFNDKETKMEKKRWWQVFRNKDENFMRFFAGSSKEFKDQSVNLITTNKNNPVNKGPIKYDMKIDVAQNNKLGVELKIAGGETLVLQSGDWDPSSLARRILREPSIGENKVRVHMVYNLYKGLLQLANEKHMKLSYFQEANPRGMHEIKLENNNIVLNTIDYETRAPFRQTTTTLFNEKLFQTTNQFNDISMHNSLQEGIDGIVKHFAYAMNHLHRDYQKSTKRSIWNGFRSENRTELPTSFWTSPIKKILNIKNVTKFDFTTTVGATEISLKNNTFTVNNPQLKNPLVSKDLGKILNTRVHKVRIFDGVERDIVEAVYSNLINKMRENSKIRRSNFGVMDSITGNLYILDENGKFGYIRRDALNGRNIMHNRFLGIVKTKAGVINSNLLRTGGRGGAGYAYHQLTEHEEKELLKNPLLMQGFVKAMNRRMGFTESVRAWFERH